MTRAFSGPHWPHPCFFFSSAFGADEFKRIGSFSRCSVQSLVFSPLQPGRSRLGLGQQETQRSSPASLVSYVQLEPFDPSGGSDGAGGAGHEANEFVAGPWVQVVYSKHARRGVPKHMPHPEFLLQPPLTPASVTSRAVCWAPGQRAPWQAWGQVQPWAAGRGRARHVPWALRPQGRPLLRWPPSRRWASSAGYWWTWPSTGGAGRCRRRSR